MEKIFPELSKLNTFKYENGELKVIASKDNFIYMMIVTMFMVGVPIVLLYLVPKMELARAVLSVIIAIPTLIFSIFATLPLIAQFFRGRCILKISDGHLKNNKLSVPVNTIKSYKFRKHPNPLRLWVYDYLEVTDTYNKKHYFNLYNMTRKETVRLMLDLYVL